MRPRSFGRQSRRKSNVPSVESVEPRIPLTAPSVAIAAPLDLIVRKNSTDSALGHGSISISDATSSGGEVVTLAIGDGTLETPRLRGVATAGERTGHLTISGSVTQVNIALARLAYRPARNFAGVDSLRVADESVPSSNSPDGPSVASSMVTATAVVPIIVASPKSGLAKTSAPAINDLSSVTTSAGVAYNFASPNQIDVSDPAVGPFSETWVGAVQDGNLWVGAAVPNAKVAGNGTNVLTVSGPLSAVNAALSRLNYAPAFGFAGSDILRMQAIDSNGASSDLATLPLQILPSVVPPTIPPAVSGNTWDGSRLVLSVDENANLRQTTNGSTIFEYENLSNQNNAGLISLTTGGSSPTFLDAPALTNQTSFVLANWAGNNLSVTNVSANDNTPIAIQAVGPGIPGTNPLSFEVGTPVQLGPGQTAQGAAPVQYLQLVVSAEPTTDTVALIGGPPDMSGNNGYVFAVNYAYDSGPGTDVAPPSGYYATTTNNSYIFSFHWGGGTIFVANLSSQDAQDPTVVLREL